MMAVGGGELDQLYIHIDYQGMGIGTLLLNLTKELSPGKQQLYTFDVNEGTQSFYEKQGFTILGRGFESQSGMADIRYEWVKGQRLRDRVKGTDSAVLTSILRFIQYLRLPDHPIAGILGDRACQNQGRQFYK